MRSREGIPWTVAGVALAFKTSDYDRMLRIAACILTILWPFVAFCQQTADTVVAAKTSVSDGNLPRARWDHKAKSALWTRASLAALETHGAALTATVPSDIAEWCPAYPTASDKTRRAFWTGFVSALTKHESTFRADAVGGGGRWFGLLQIVPATARGYGCQAQTGKELRKGTSNLSCAIRIMATTVPRDGVIASGFKGVAADWGPLRSPRKRSEMMDWIAKQSYCKPATMIRPKQRPEALVPRLVLVESASPALPPQAASLRPKARPDRAIARAEDLADVSLEPPDVTRIRPRMRPIAEGVVLTKDSDPLVRPRLRPQRLAQSDSLQ